MYMKAQNKPNQPVQVDFGRSFWWRRAISLSYRGHNGALQGGQPWRANIG